MAVGGQRLRQPPWFTGLRRAVDLACRAANTTDAGQSCQPVTARRRTSAIAEVLNLATGLRQDWGEALGRDASPWPLR